MQQRHTLFSLFTCAALLAAGVFAAPQAHAAGRDLIVPVSRSELVTLARDMDQVLVADPEVADITVHSPTQLSIIGRKMGATNIRAFDKENNVIASFNIIVSYDLPAIRRALNNFLPDEAIAVDVVSNNLALSGQVSSSSAADQAVRIVNEYLRAAVLPSNARYNKDEKLEVINLMQVASGQQVMLRVRVGEIQRTAMKQLGLNLSAVRGDGNFGFQLGTGGGLGSTSTDPIRTLGDFALGNDTRSAIGFSWEAGGNSFAALLEALESDGLFKTLAEPNLVALSGEKAEFLAGGEFPIPVVQGSTGNTTGGTSITVEYRQFGVGIQFTPYVLSRNRIRIDVQPEVSEIDNTNAVKLNNFTIPGLATRRAKTTVELAPGESFMIAGLINDKMSTEIGNMPGLKEVPILGALFRSTAFKRNETELVIAVTPYLVDPLKGSDIRLPTDNLKPASFMESVFYGALGTLNGDAQRISQTPQLEGPIGFMVD